MSSHASPIRRALPVDTRPSFPQRHQTGAVQSARLDAGQAILVCLVAVANLNLFEPQRNRAMFLLASCHLW